MTIQLLTTRIERGEAIAKLEGQVKRIDDYTYTVKSQSGMGEYFMSKVDGEWIFECPDNKYRHVKCKQETKLMEQEAGVFTQRNRALRAKCLLSTTPACFRKSYESGYGLIDKYYS